MNTINNNLQVLSNPQIKLKVSVADKTNDSETVKPSSLKADNITVGIKKGIVPTLKGSGAGLLGNIPIAVVIVGSEVAKDASLAVGLAFIVGGAIGGSVSANVTNSKIKGIGVGALTGAVTGGVVGLVTSKSIGIGAAVAVVGGLAGASGGFFGSLVAKEK